MRRSLWGMLLAVVPLAASGQGKEAKTAPPPVQAATVRATGGVNWEGQVLRATGSGAPDLKAANPSQARLGAERSAKTNAFNNLVDQARGIPISSGHVVGDAMARDDVRNRVEGAIRGYKVVAKRFYSDSGVEVDVEVPLASITAALIDAAQGPIALNAEGAKKYTGLVVDARGVQGVKPVLSPRLLDAAGKALYGSAALSDEARGATGVASWYESLEAAKKAALVGEKPLVVKATGLQGSDLVLSADDVKALAEVNTRFLAEGRVAIVTR